MPLSEIYDHALYDKLHVGPGGPVEEPCFFNRPVGFGARLFRGGAARDVTASLGDTNTYIAGTVAPGEQSIVGIVHRLHAPHPWHQTRVETWWLGAAQGAHVSLRVIDKAYLELPLTSLPLLGPFESPFAQMSEALITTDAEGRQERQERTWAIERHWRIDPHLVIAYPWTFAVLVRFPSAVQPPLEFDVEVMLLGLRKRPMQ